MTALALFPLLACSLEPAWSNHAFAETASVTPVSAAGLLENEQNTIEIFDAVAPAVVFVTQKRMVRSWISGTTTEATAGSGTGFVWDADGHIVTNYHVVQGASSLSVTLQDGRTLDAEFVGGEPRKDIAVLKIDADSLTPIRRPDADLRLFVGQKAVAIGNPFGLGHSLSVGVISALDREIGGFGDVAIRGMVQTDAAINPGNSGGPLLNSAGQLIGMNTQIATASGDSAGVGFAVPVQTIERAVPQIIENGFVQQVGLGVSLIPDHVARREGVIGVIIRDVQPESPAAAAGLEGLQTDGKRTWLGDVITALDGVPIHSYGDLYNALDEHEPGDTVTLTVDRRGEIRSVDVAVYALPRQ
jgi:S1-C subfamily serine protease